jgi:ubiquinone/menaquinone biosynthesis C-methylase UbiE
MNQDQETPADYLFASATDEIRRLHRQAVFLRRFTQHLLDVAGITSGMQVLDVGTGIGDVALLVAERVGPQGSVVGIDMNPAMLDVARERAQAAGLTNVTFRQAELSQLVLDDQFDAVVGRFILLYIQDRAALLRRLSQQLKPGGILAFEEPDLTLLGTTLPPAPVYAQAAGRLKEVFVHAGLDMQSMNLFRVFADAGFPSPELELITTVGGPDWAGHEQVADITSALLPLMVRFEIATEEAVQVQTLQQRLREEAARLHSVSAALGLMHVWTRVA